MTGAEQPFGLKPEILGKLVGVFKNHSKVQQVLVYGSRAKGNFRRGSDIDITMKGGDLSGSDLRQIEQEIDELLLPYKVDLSIYDQIDSEELLAHIQRCGKKLS